MTDFDTEAAGDALEALADGPAAKASAAIEAAFEKAGDSIERALARAASSGELSFKRLTDAILRDLARLAAEQFIERPVGQLLDRVLGDLPLFGARADGGPVVPGGGYLVGERGPEVFVPQSAGTIAAPGGQAVTVNINVAPGSDLRQVEQSEGRIARSIARAAARGSRWS